MTPNTSGLHYLKATDEETFNQALLDCGWAWETEYVTTVDEETGEETVTDEVIREAGTSHYTATHSLDVIGTIHVETGNTLTQTDDDGNTFEYPETTPIDGWHANLLLHGEEIPAELEAFVIDAPATPVRKFA